MTTTRVPGILAALAIGVAACGGDRPADDEPARDLSLAPAESVAALADVPATDAGQPTETLDVPRAARPPATHPAREPAPRVVTMTLPAGTVITLAASDTLTSRHNAKGEPVVATNAVAVVDDAGRVVIPPAAIFSGTISDIAPAESPGGEGRLVLTFNRVQFGGTVFEVQARTDSIGAFMKGRGVTAGDAAKVGAGAVVGAVAGRIIGGNRTGTIVGAVAGAAAGAGIAAATRDIDIILPEGAPIRLVLTAPFVVEMQM